MTGKRVLSIDAAKFEQWKKFDSIHNDENTDDHTICPKCRDQILFCGCIQQLADEILSNAIEDQLKVRIGNSDHLDNLQIIGPSEDKKDEKWLNEMIEAYKQEKPLPEDDHRTISTLMNAVSMVVDEIDDNVNPPTENEQYLLDAWDQYHEHMGRDDE